MVFIICLTSSVKYMEIRKFTIHLIKVVLASVPVFAVGKLVMTVTSSVLLSSVLTVILTVIIYVAILIVLKDEFLNQVVCDVKRTLENKEKKGD